MDTRKANATCSLNGAAYSKLVYWMFNPHLIKLMEPNNLKPFHAGLCELESTTNLIIGQLAESIVDFETDKSAASVELRAVATRAKRFLASQVEIIEDIKQQLEIRMSPRQEVDLPL